MNPTLDPPASGTRPGFASALRALPPTALPFFAAAVVFSTMAMANAPASWLHGSSAKAASAHELPSAGAAVAPALADGQAKVRARFRCESCGVVETIRRIGPVGELVVAYEFTVRLRDGSTRISSDASQAKWRIGDSVMVIGGAKPSTQ